MFLKIAWPVPLNRAHPPTGLFVKDCNEQCNDDIVCFILFSLMNTKKIMSKKSKTVPQDPKQLLLIFLNFILVVPSLKNQIL